MDIKAELTKLDIQEGDVIVVKGDTEEAGTVASRIADGGLLPKGSAIIVMAPEIDVFALRNASQDIKKQIFDAMALEGVTCDW